MADNNQMKEILAKLDEGVKSLFDSGKYAEYLSVMSRFHNYSTRNTLLIYAQNPNAHRVAGYNSWINNFKRHVKRGEHGIKILAPIAFKDVKETVKLDPESKQPILDEDGNALMETRERVGARFKTVSVFDISQTEGEPLPELAETLTGSVERYELFMDALRAVSPLPIGFEQMPSDTDGICYMGDRIAIREGMSEIQSIAAVIHEMAHAKLHDGNSLDAEGKPKTKRVEEVEAESVSYVVCQKFGVETGANAFGYVGSWSKNEDTKELQASLDTIRKAAAELIDGIEEKYRELAKERGIDLTVSIPAKEQEPTAPEMSLDDVLNNREEMIRRIMDYVVKDDPEFPVRALEGMENDYRSAPIEGLREAYFFYFPNDPPTIAKEKDEMSAEQIDDVIDNETLADGEIPANDRALTANIQGYIQSYGRIMDISDDEIYQTVLRMRDEGKSNDYRDIAEYMLNERTLLEFNFRKRLSAMSEVETPDEKYKIAFNVLVEALCANKELLAVAESGAVWQEGAGRKAVFNSDYYKTLTETYSTELADLLADKSMENRLRNTVLGETYRRLDAIAYDRYTLDEYANITKSGRLDTYETPYPEDSVNTGILVHLMERLPDGGIHDYGYIFGYDPDDKNDHAIRNYLSLKSFAELRESVFGKSESNITLNYKETEPVGSTVLRRLLYTDGMFNRELKRTRVDVLPPMGKYSIYAQHLSGVIGDDTLIHVGTDSGYLLPLGVSRTRFDEQFIESRIDNIFEKAPVLLEKALADPEQFARYDWGAITGRISEIEAHNAPVRKLREEKDRVRREEAAKAEKEEQRQKTEKYDARVDEIATAIGEGKTIAVGYKEHEFDGKNPVLDLFRLYGVELPLRTQGWVNTGLAELSGDGYRYYKSKHKGNSTAFSGYFNKLREAIKAEPIDVKRGRSAEQKNETMNGGEDMQYSELQEKGFEYARQHAHLPLNERLNIIAQSFGVKSASVFIQPCTGKYRGQSDIMLRLENGGTMGIGMRSNAAARKDSVISECVNNALAKYNPEIVAEAKARAASALKAREAEDNINAEQRGLKPYKFLNVELCDGGSGNGHTGWYYATIAVDNKVIGFITTDLASDIERGVLTDYVTRANYFVAGGLRDEDADFVFNNVGHSSVKDSYTVEMSGAARERAEKTLAELSQPPSLTPDDKDFWRSQIAEFLASNDGKMELADLDLPPIGNHGGLGKFFQVFGDYGYKREFANIVAEENTKRTGEPWIAFNFCEGGEYRPDFFKTPSAMLFSEADAFIRGYEQKVREMYDGGYDKLDYTLYYKRGDNEVCAGNDRYDIGDSKKVSGFYNVLLAETDYYYSHPDIYTSIKPDGDIKADKERDYADIAILKKAVTTIYPYVEIEKVIRYAEGDRLDQRVFNKGEILPFAEADIKIKREEKAMREQYVKKYGKPGDGDEELGIAVHYKLPGDSEPSVFRVSYLLGDYDEERGGLLKHFEMGATYYNACIRNGDYGNVNAMLGGETADDAIRLAAEYTMTYETLRDSMAEPKEKAAAEQTASVAATLPDPAVSIADMTNYGYTADEMLPLSQARALKLFDKDNTVYLLYPDNTEAMAFDRDEISQHDGFFGIEKADWEKVRAADERESERSLEAYFFGSNDNSKPITVTANSMPPATAHTNMFGIYQVRDDIENGRDIRFASLEELGQRGFEPDRSNYKLVYAAPFSDSIEFLTDRQPVLNKLFEQFNSDHPADYTGRSMSMSDVVVLRYNGDMSAHYVDRGGFAEIGKFDFYGESPDNSTQAQTAEQKSEPAGQTFYQVEKRSDNTPTVAELEADVNAGKAISLLDLANAVNAEKKRPPMQKSKPDFLAKIEANKQRVSQANGPAAQKTNQMEVE